MLLDLLVKTVQDKMENAQRAMCCRSLTPTVFFSTTGEKMIGWSEDPQVIDKVHPPGIAPLDEEARKNLLDTDGVILTLFAGDCEGREDVEYLNTRIVPFVIKAMDVQCVIWAGSARMVGVQADDINSSEEAQEAIQQLVHEEGFDALLARSMETLMLIAVDREVVQCRVALIKRDPDGHFDQLSDWTPGPEELENHLGGFMSFASSAQKALRGG